MTLSVSLSLALLLAQGPEPTLRRFALIAGANEGGQGRTTLRYATSDARAVARVLTQLGGVQAGDVVLAEEPTPTQLGAAFDALQARLGDARSGSARLQVFFYYSGHSDEEGLLLRGERVGYAALRRRLDALAADVRIAVVDSCASGALTLPKGGAPRPSFLVDSSTSLSGHAFLTSASADEAAQESERLQASVFTHYFLSGLRGAADANRDGRVTLGEAYQHAFAETLARTTSTRAGPQRPGWDLQLVGTGELVLTDLRASDARLVLDADVSGRVHVLRPRGELVVEVAKLAGKPVELGLEVGAYRVVVDDGAGGVGEAAVEFTAPGSRTLSRAGLTPTKLEATVLRGDEPLPHLPVEVALVPPLSVAGAWGKVPRVNFGLGLVGVRVGAVDGALVGAAFGWSDGPLRGVGVGGALLKTGTLSGVGLAGAVLVTSGALRGIGLAPVQVVAGGLAGVSAGVASIAAGDATGAQLGVLNVASGVLRGAQLGAFNVAGQGFRGVQASVVNVAPGSGWGGQLGLVNVGGEVSGAQVGLINVASHVKGLQLGLVNVAKTASAPIGLVNVITEGRFHLAAFAAETSVANVAVKAGSPHVYGLASVGFNPRGTVAGQVHVAFGLGLGGRVRKDKWYGEVEAQTEVLQRVGGPWSGVVQSAGLRVNVGFQAWERFAFFAGPQLHVHVALANSGDVRALSSWGFDVASSVRLVPGLVAGVQVF